MDVNEELKGGRSGGGLVRGAVGLGGGQGGCE